MYEDFSIHMSSIHIKTLSHDAWRLELAELLIGGRSNIPTWANVTVTRKNFLLSGKDTHKKMYCHNKNNDNISQHHNITPPTQYKQK